MRVLAAHSYYRQRGGEDVSFETEVGILRLLGTTVETATWHNQELATQSLAVRAKATLRNRAAEAKLAQAMADFRPDVLYMNNWFPFLSPNIYRPAHEQRVPIVQAVRNYRMTCPAGTLFRSGADCHDCSVGNAFLPSVVHSCYHSYPASLLASRAIAHGWRAGTFENYVDLYLCVSEYVRESLALAGISSERMAVKPNTVWPEPTFVETPSSGTNLLVASRLAPGKGVAEFILAFKKFGAATTSLNVVGDGPLRDEVARAASGDARITLLGTLDHSETLQRMGMASCVVVPSQWHEPFGRVAVEALSLGTPVAAAKRGGLASLPEEESATFKFDPSNEISTAQAILWACAANRRTYTSRLAARQVFDSHFSPKIVGEVLLKELLRAAGMR